MKKTSGKTKKNIITSIVILVILITVLIIVFVIKSKSLDPNSDLVTEIYSYIGNNDLEVSVIC